VKDDITFWLREYSLSPSQASLGGLVNWGASERGEGLKTQLDHPGPSNQLNLTSTPKENSS